MRLQELMDKGMYTYVELPRIQREKEHERFINEKAEFREKAGESLHQWLGELALDFDIKEVAEERDPGFAIWDMRPHSWRVDMVMEVKIPFFSSAREVSIRAGGDGVILSLDEPVGDSFIQFMTRVQLEHDARLEGEIDNVSKWLSTTRDQSHLLIARTQLERLAPERAAEWDEMMASSLEGVAKRRAAIGRYQEALEEWRRICVDIDRHNEAVVRRLRETLGDVKRPAHLVEYGVQKKERQGEDRVWVERAPDEMGWASVIEKGGKVEVWRFKNIIRIRKPEFIRPLNYPALFMSQSLGRETVYYLEAHQDLVDEAADEILAYPSRPLWSDISDGLPWDSDVDWAVSAALGTAPPSVSDTVPF